MLSEIYYSIIRIYEAYRGNGKIIALVLLAVLMLYLARNLFDFDPFALVLSPVLAIAFAMSKTLGLARNLKAENAVEASDGDKKTKRNRILTTIFVLFLMIFAITMSGEYVFGDKHVAKADNMLGIPQDYVEVMDFVLDMEEYPSVVAMPDYSMYHRIYSSRFNMLYELRSDDDYRYLSENARNAFLELSSSSPDMKKLADTAIAADCDFIIMKKGSYWSEFSIERYGFKNAKSFDGWDVYVRREAMNAK